jgi:hypothetical protein
MPSLLRRTGAHPKTISRALARGSAPRGPRARRLVKLAPFLATADRLLSEGVRNAVVIHRSSRSRATGAGSASRDATSTPSGARCGRAERRCGSRRSRGASSRATGYDRSPGCVGPQDGPLHRERAGLLAADARVGDHSGRRRFASSAAHSPRTRRWPRGDDQLPDDVSAAPSRPASSSPDFPGSRPSTSSISTSSRASIGGSFASLAGLSLVERAHNVVLLGPPGVPR